MLQNQNTAIRGTSSLPPTAPAQTPTEFAAQVARLADEMNARLSNLRYRLFGDEQSPEENSLAKAETPLQALITGAHKSLCVAMDQISAIHSRL